MLKFCVAFLTVLVLFYTQSWAQTGAPLGPISGSGSGSGGSTIVVPGTLGQIVTANGLGGFSSSVTPSISAGCGNVIGAGSIGNSLVGSINSTLQPVTSNANLTVPVTACGQLWQASSTGNLTWTLPEAGSTGYGNYWYATFCDINTGSLTIITSGGTIGGASSYTITSGSQLAPSCIAVAGDNVSNYALVAGGSGGGGSGNVSGPASATSGDAVAFGDATGKTIVDSGIVAANIITGPASATSGDVMFFSGSGGKVAADSNFPGASIASLTAQDQTLSGGANAVTVNLGTPTSGSTLTVDCGKGPYQALFNNVLGFTLAAPTTVSASGCTLMMVNGSAAGTITFSGWTEGATSGDALTTTSGSTFSFSIYRITGIAGAKSHYLISAYQ